MNTKKQDVPIIWQDVQEVAQAVPQFATMLENAALRRMLNAQNSATNETNSGKPKNAGPPAPVPTKKRKAKNR